MQYEDLAADGVFIPLSAAGEKPAAPQLPPGWESAVVQNWGSGLGETAVGLGGFKRGAGGRKESASLSHGWGKGAQERREGREGWRLSAPFNKQTAVLGAVTSARTPHPLQKCCKITESLLIFSIFC